jgi:putative SOS response-associated peptidase YedK
MEKPDDKGPRPLTNGHHRLIRLLAAQAAADWLAAEQSKSSQEQHEAAGSDKR